MTALLTAEMARSLLRATISLNVDDKATLPALYAALSAIATGRAQVVRFVNDRDPPVDVQVVTVDEAGNFGVWVGDKDENAGDWKRKWGGGLTAIYWIDGLNLP